MSEEAIRRYLKAFEQGDWAAMAELQDPQILFTDSLMGQFKGKEAQLLCQLLAQRKDARRHFRIDSITPSGPDEWLVKWQAEYPFSPTGRLIRNQIESRYRFKNGKIVEYSDTFSVWRWFRSAMGWKGWLVGWMPRTKTVFRKKIRERLEQ